MIGHEIINSYRTLLKERFKEDSIFIEIGSERGHGSTFMIANLCKDLNFIFKTIDADPGIANNAEKIVKSINSNFEAINKEGEKFLEEIDEFHIIYLDAFDLQHMSDRPVGSYVKSTRGTYANRNVDLTNENCWKMHYDCAVACVEKMPKGGIIFFDDVYSSAPEWDGKGKTAIPYLLSNGFSIIEYKPNALVLEKTV